MNAKFLIFFLVILGLGLSLVYGFTMKHDPDSQQLLDRGEHFLSTGELIPYGNVASSGVKVYTPGSFLSAAVGVPMSIWNSPHAPVIFISILHIIGFLLMCLSLKSIYSLNFIVFFTLLYWCSPWRTSEVFLWNPAYLLFFTPLHFWSAVKVINKPKDFLGSLAHVVALFGALQVHASFVALVIISAFLIVKRAFKPSVSGIAVGFSLGLASLIPYMVFKFSDVDLAEGSAQDGSFLFRGLVYVYPFLKGIWYWVRHGSFAFPTHLSKDLDFLWLGGETYEGLFQGAWMGLTVVLALVSVIFSGWASFHFFKSYKRSLNPFLCKPHEFANPIEFYIYAAFLSLLTVSALTPADTNFWHLMIFYPIAALIPCRALELAWQSKAGSRWIPKALSLTALYFTLFTLVTANSSEKHQGPGLRELISEVRQLILVRD